MLTDLSLLVTLGSVTCSQSSLDRSPLWVMSYGQLQCLPTSLYRFPMAGLLVIYLHKLYLTLRFDWLKPIGTIVPPARTYISLWKAYILLHLPKWIYFLRPEKRCISIMNFLRMLKFWEKKMLSISLKGKLRLKFSPDFEGYKKSSLIQK